MMKRRFATGRSPIAGSFTLSALLGCGLPAIIGCAASQDGSVSSAPSKKAVGDDTTVGAQQQGGFNWVWVGGGGTLAGLLTLGMWLRHGRKIDAQQNQYTLDLIKTVKNTEGEQHGA